MFKALSQSCTSHSALAAARNSRPQSFQEEHFFSVLHSRSAFEGFFSGTKMILNGDHPCTIPAWEWSCSSRVIHTKLSRLSGTQCRRSAQTPLAGFDSFCTSCHPLWLLWLLPLSPASEYCPLAKRARVLVSTIHELVREDESSAGLPWGWGDAKLRGGKGVTAETPDVS